MMVLHGKLEALGPVKQGPGHVVIDRLELEGQVVEKLCVPDTLKRELVVGHDMSLYIQRVFSVGLLLGVAEDYSIKTVGLVPLLLGAILCLFLCVYFCLWGVLEPWSYWVGIPMAFVTYYLFSLCVGLIHFGR